MDNKAMINSKNNSLKKPLKISFLLSGLFCIQTVCATTVLEEKIQAFVPSGYSVLASQVADLNADGLLDVVLVSEQSDDPHSPRLLQVLQNTGKSYKVYQNTQLIPCNKCGGPSEEPTFRKLKVGSKKFSVQVYWGGIKNGYLKTLSFAYSPTHKDWLLRDTRLIRFDNAHQQDVKYATTHHQVYTQKTGVRFERATYN
jgi:hypothetical protein